MENQDGKLVIPKFTPKESSSNSKEENKSEESKCPVCNGTGREQFYTITEEMKMVYGDDVVPTLHVRKCPVCSGFRRMDEDLTLVPDMYREADITNFRYEIYDRDMSNLKAIIESFLNEFNSRWKSQGMGLYLWSKTPGSGKTFLACCLGKSTMIKYNIRFKFTTVVDYIDKVSERITIAKAGGWEDPSAIFRECELLVLDDIGAHLSKDWHNQELFKLVNERMANGLVTIYTSNYKLEDLDIDDRIKSRVSRQAIQINMPEMSIRQKDQQLRQAEFLKGIVRK